MLTEILYFCAVFQITFQAQNKKKNEIPEIKFVQLLCEFDEETFYPNASCFLKTWNRRITTGNIYTVQKYPWNEIFIIGHVYFKTNNYYREVITTPQVEFCSLMKFSTSNNFLKQIIDLAESVAPGVIHTCPYVGANIFNVTAPKLSLISSIPSGEYKFIVNIATQPNGKFVYNLTVEYVKNSIKDRLG
ncbi:hypothetical protein PVAND_014433 [Polypedilum vanderplanki]|uniref:Uncharacterized protein n=1 Tax=Polypedilum vanderplanki TaxID=319348 RepID=A0A9J6B9E2_POLVA|nr:hypothetical protein PVAND_014433 [Polypedilum vanderplanki]